MSEAPVRITEYMTEHGHEQMVFVTDPPSGLRAVIAVHSTALGPSLGGIRFWRYPVEQDAALDALRLSEAMSFKASMAGLHQGGGKAVVLCDDPVAPRSEALLLALGRAIDELGGRYLAAEDVGATPRDMEVISRETPWVTGVAGPGGSGDPSPVTAFGVLKAMGPVLEELDGDPTVKNRRVVVQGAGHVGTYLVELLVGEGARVAVADIRADRVEDLVRRHGVDAVPVDRVLEEPCDVLSPCALGGVVSTETVPILQCRAICGGANNQLDDLAAGDSLAARGIPYAPDFVANAGGIINIAEEFVGYDRDRALARAAGIAETTRRVFEYSRTAGIAPARAADQLARQRIAEEGSRRRWRPGDPTAWTNGEPLRTLRPTDR